jgi:hypothetical protein
MSSENTAATAVGHSPSDAARYLALAAELTRLGFETSIEADGRVACVMPITPAAAASLAEESTRREVVALGRAHGLLHVAVVIGDG